MAVNSSLRRIMQDSRLQPRSGSRSKPSPLSADMFDLTYLQVRVHMMISRMNVSHPHVFKTASQSKLYFYLKRLKSCVTHQRSWTTGLTVSAKSPKPWYRSRAYSSRRCLHLIRTRGAANRYFHDQSPIKPVISHSSSRSRRAALCSHKCTNVRNIIGKRPAQSKYAESASLSCAGIRSAPDDCANV